ncbi:uncharacterized protein LOC123522866 [Mercenaria mercenaria]|uniref:uncharacterized protein LOC123522866 n=1 Tax=Mercenaria mercenaria TaxID=6596 RepID=UPI00234E4615|nr:uncharacterized protein LOC123522866 [Mercenaria mercenaria]
MPQNSDREDEEMMALLPSDIWFNGACNIPFHIGGILLYLINTAISQSGIPHVFDDIVCRAPRLSGYFKDLNIYTFLKSRFRGHGLLNKIGFGNALLGSNVSGLTVKNESSTIEVYIAYCTKLMDKNKILTLIVILLLLAGRVEGGPVRENDTAEGHDRSLFTTFPLPESLWCQIPEKDIECPVGDYAFELKTENCQYECPSWEQIICMNSEQGMVFFCIPKGTTCSQGIGWNVEHIDSTDVVVKESSCPEGYYQEEPSKCHNACKTRHLSLEIIPIQFKIFSKGDHSHPTKLMCDYTAGYYNANNKSYIRYDGNFAYYYQDFCTHINISNPCSSGQIPLYNGTCVDKCSTGYERDETDFKCKALKDNRSDRNPKTSFVTPAGQDKVTTSERNTEISIDRTGEFLHMGFPSNSKVMVIIKFVFNAAEEVQVL